MRLMDIEAGMAFDKVRLMEFEVGIAFDNVRLVCSSLS